MGNGARDSFAVSFPFRFSAFIVCVGSDISSSRSSSTVRDGSASGECFFDETSLCLSLCCERCRTFGLRVVKYQ